VAAARVHRTAVAIRGVNRRPEARHEVHHTRDSGRAGRSIGALSGARREDRSAETGRSTDEPRGQSSVLVRDPRHLVPAVTRASSW